MNATKGPWRRSFDAVYAGTNDTVRRIAVVPRNGDMDAETEANINLIAAAPQLLEALETLAAYANGRLGANPYCIPEYKQALLAIAAARGMDPKNWMDANNEAYSREAAKREAKGG